jgi:putative nucleotidyltransferase with HDIG domain
MKASILFVDDEPMLLQGLRRNLRHMRDEWEMLFAESAEEALHSSRIADLDAVVTDMRMPGMGGAAFLQRVVERNPRAVRIVLSGQIDKENAYDLIGVGHQFLSKPCDIEVLIGTLRRALALRSALVDEALQTTVANLGSLPCPSAVYNELVAELDREEPSMNRIAQIVSRDLGLTATVLHIASFGFFGSHGRLTNPVQAVTRLGVERVKALVLSHGVVTEYQEDNLKDMGLDKLWQHSVRCACLAQEIAKDMELGKKEIEQAFVAGLLHDIGALVLATNMPDAFRKVVQASPREDTIRLEAERLTLPTIHGTIGAYLAALWGLPDPVVEAIAYHHEPSMGNSSDFTPLAAVHVAEGLTQAVHGCRPDEPGIKVLDFDYLNALGVADRLASWAKIFADHLKAE